MGDRFASVLEIAGLTDVGLRRQYNEDTFGIDANAGLAVVCDGMGGHANGDVASALAVETLCSALAAHANTSDDTTVPGKDPARREYIEATRHDDGHSLEAAIVHANARIHEENQRREVPEGQGMGTTVAGILLGREPRTAHVFHVGDSRVYRFAAGVLTPLTRDHTLYESWLSEGSQGAAPKRNIITQALGPVRSIEPSLGFESFEAGDLVLICSDGLSAMVHDDAIATALRETDPGSDLSWICRRLIGLALDAGGRDNITVVVGRWA